MPRSNDWDDWKWQVRNRITSSDELSKIVSLSDREIHAIAAVSGKYRWAVSPYYAGLMDKHNADCPIRRQSIPDVGELEDPLGVADPKGEEGRLPVPCLFQLYANRVVLYVTNCCPGYCRHCFRKRRIGDRDEHTPVAEVERAIDYIGKSPAIRDVLITGGDAFMLSDDRIDHILARLRRFDHVEIIRFGTRTLCTLPQRITPELVKAVARHHPVWINTQFNHPKEITDEAAGACDILLSHGIPLGNQTVLLKGINDDTAVMMDLMHKLIKMRVRPYYLFHCHFVAGSSHFRTSLDKGTEIIRGLQGHTTGFAVPRYVVSTRIGKIPLDPDYVLERGIDRRLLSNYQGRTIEVPVESSDAPPKKGVGELPR